MKKFLVAAFAAVALLATTSACSEIADYDKVGIWYAQGQIDGNHFDHCVPPGKTDDVSVNDTVYWLPNNLRTWNIAPEGGDSNQPLRIVAKPDTGQATGLEVNVWPQVNFMLNTYCGTDERDLNSPLVQWWQRLGSRYGANEVDGWRNMLLNTVVPALEKAKNILRDYTADQLVTGVAFAEAESKFAQVFSTELERVSGGNFFCGPDFDRAANKCSQVAVLLKDADYADPGVQAARNEKQKAVEQAAAKVAEAQGAVAAAEAQKQLYQNPTWVQLQLAQKQLEIAQACAASAKCQMILDSTGRVQILSGS